MKNSRLLNSWESAVAWPCISQVNSIMMIPDVLAASPHQQHSYFLIVLGQRAFLKGHNHKYFNNEGFPGLYLTACILSILFWNAGWKYLKCTRVGNFRTHIREFLWLSMMETCPDSPGTFWQALTVKFTLSLKDKNQKRKASGNVTFNQSFELKTFLPSSHSGGSAQEIPSFWNWDELRQI